MSRCATVRGMHIMGLEKTDKTVDEILGATFVRSSNC